MLCRFAGEDQVHTTGNHGEWSRAQRGCMERQRRAGDDEAAREGAARCAAPRQSGKSGGLRGNAWRYKSQLDAKRRRGERHAGEERPEASSSATAKSVLEKRNK